MRKAAVKIVEVPAFELIDLILLNAKGKRIGRACASGPSFKTAAAHKINVIVTTIVDYLFLSMLAQTFLQLYLHNQVNRHYLFLGKFMAVTVLPIRKGIPFFPFLLSFLIVELKSRHISHSMNAFGTNLHFYLS